MGVIKKLGKKAKKLGRKFDRNVVQPVVQPVKKPVRKVEQKLGKHGITVSPTIDTTNGARANVAYRGVPVAVPKARPMPKGRCQ